MSFHGGIEIDGDRVRATVVEGSPKKYRVVDFLDGRITGESDEERRESLRSILGEAFFAKERAGLDVASSIGADRAILREINVPYTRDDMIAKTVRFESESYILSHSIDDLIIEFLKCSETDSGSRLVICALEKRRLSEEIERLRAIGIDPIGIELDATALATAWARSEPTAGEGSTLLVQIERQHTIFVLLEEGRITKLRSVWNSVRTDAPRLPAGERGGETPPASAIEDRFAAIERSLSGLDGGGGGVPDAATAGARGGADSLPWLGAGDDPEPPFALIPDEDYERFISGAGASAGGEAAAPGTGIEAEGMESGRATLALAVAGDPFDRIVLELERTFAGHLLGGSIDRLVVTGAEAPAMDAIARLGERFEVEARPMPLDQVESTLSPEAAEAFRDAGSVSFGLALRSLGLPANAFELRREEFRFERRFERLMPSLTLAGLLLCVLSLVWMVDEHRGVKSAKQEIAVLRDKQADLYESFFGTPPREDAKDIHRAAQERLKAFTGRSGSQGGQRMKQYYGAMEVLKDFYLAVERASPKIYPKYESFDFDPERKKGKKSSVKLRVPKAEDVQALSEALRAHSQIFDALVSPTQDNKTGEFEVTVDLIVKADSK